MTMGKKIKHFKTNVLLKSIIGKDLINDDNIAILELVKNSYDANSKEVKVIFQNLKTNDDLTQKEYSNNSSKIVIQDYGTGMNESDLENKWLNIAYSEKKVKKVEFDRVLAGAKGVGRFSCDRLGEYLDIYTRKKGGDIFHLFVDWKSFEIENQQDLEIQKINIELRVINANNFAKETGYELFSHGTILEISKLRSKWASFEKNKWDVNRIIELKKSLEKLINPNQAFNKSSFAIQLVAEEFVKEDKGQPDHSKLNVEIKNKIFEKLDFTSTCISSLIDGEGKTITTTITDKGRDIFILQEKNTLFPFLRDVSIVLYYLNTYSKIYFARQTGIRSVDFGSVYLFINGFRIPPYGDLGDDWLGLEIRKGQGYARFLGTRELIGRMEIKDNSNQFRIVSSREGLVKDKSFNQLVDTKSGYFYYTLKRLEKYVVDGLDWDRLSKKKKTSTEKIDDVDDNQSLKNYISEFEKKVNAKNWKFSPGDEKYFENQHTKNRRILSIIDDIIDVKPENIIDLYINEELIVELVNAEKEKTKEDFQKLIEDIPNLSDEQVNDLLDKIQRSKGDLENTLKKIDEFPSNKINNETLSAFKISSKLLLNTNKDIEKNFVLINKLVEQKNEALRKQKEEEDARLKAEQENNELTRLLELEREKNTYLRTSSRSLSEDAKGLVHNIKITSKAISTNVDNLYHKILEGKAKNSEILKALGNIKFHAEKALKISRLITRSNFNTEKNEQIVDLVKYINQYIEIYSDIYEKNKLEFEVKSKNAELTKKASVLDISIVLDDLISNSEKAEATLVRIEMSNPSKDSLKLIFSDNGNGVPEIFLDNPEEIFELGVTTTDGSGIGLQSVRTALKAMKGSIKFLGNGIKLRGASFEINIS